jgi:phospholipase D1/2
MGEMSAGVAIPVPARSGTIFDPGRNCYVAARASRVALLVDAENYFRAFAHAAERAMRSIIIIGWDFDSRTRLTWDADSRGIPTVLGDFLNYLVRRRRGLNIYILNWDYPMVFGKDREVRPLYGLGWTPRRRVHLHYDNTHPIGASHHQKIVVIDDALAFSGGLDLTCRRWDTCSHDAGDHRRMVDGEAYPPFHDSMAAVDADAAQVLAQLARTRWLLATRESIPTSAGADDPWPTSLEPDLHDVDVGISRTVPKTDVLEEVREVEALYLDLIAAAKRYIYIENQYFTSDRIGAALAARLAEPEPPEIVLVTRLLSHGWLEEHTMHVLRTRLIKQLRAADRHHRFEIYYPFVPGLEEGTCIDCHSKLMVIDDEWLRIGSANLSNRSMGFDTECDLTIEAGGKPRVSEDIREFRDRLLAEHLGTSIERVRDTVQRAGSLHATIRELQCNPRTLRVAADVPDWSETVINLASVADPERPVSLEQLIAQFKPSTKTEHSGPAWGKIAMIALAIFGLTMIWRYTPVAEIVTAERVMDWARSVGDLWWAPLAVIAAYTPAAFVMFPRPLITLFAVIAFGPWIGFVTSMTGIVGAALSTYYAGQVLPRDTVRRLAGEKLNQMSEVLRRRGLLAVFAVRIVPVAPFFVEGMVAGAVRIKVWHYIAGTMLGMAPGTLTTTVFGDQLATALEDPSRINYWLVAAVAVFFVALIWYVRRWFVKEQRRSSGPAQAEMSQHARRPGKAAV